MKDKKVKGRSQKPSVHSEALLNLRQHSGGWQKYQDDQCYVSKAHWAAGTALDSWRNSSQCLRRKKIHPRSFISHDLL